MPSSVFRGYRAEFIGAQVVQVQFLDQSGHLSSIGRRFIASCGQEALFIQFAVLAVEMIPA
jgi:hypothetical protein